MKLAKQFGRDYDSVNWKFWRIRQEYSKVYREPLHFYRKFSEDDLNILCESFDRNNYPDQAKYNRLVIKLGGTKETIHTWFKRARKKNNYSRHKQNKRQRFRSNQVQKLESVFNEDKYPDTEVITDFAVEFGSEERAIRDWFYRRRAKYNKENNCKLKKDSIYSEEDLEF